MSLFTESKNIQEKLGKPGVDLGSSGNANTIQNVVKRFTEIISECRDKTSTIKKRGKIKKTQENFDIVRIASFL